MIKIALTKPNEEMRKGKCIQLTWKGVKYALKVVNGNNTVFEVSEERAIEYVDNIKNKRQKRNRSCSYNNNKKNAHTWKKTKTTKNRITKILIS